MLIWLGGMLANQGTLTSFLIIMFSPSLEVFGLGGGAVGGGNSLYGPYLGLCCLTWFLTALSEGKSHHS